MTTATMKKESLDVELRAARLAACVKAIYENHNWIPFAEAYFTISPKLGLPIPFRANYLQRSVCADRMAGKLRTKRLKSRQMGSTSAEICAAFAEMLVTPNFTVIFASDDILSAQRIATTFVEPLVRGLHADAKSLVESVELVKRELRVTHKNGLGKSILFIGGLRDETFGIGHPVHYAVMTEAAYAPPKGWSTWRNIVEAMPREHSIICIESTANGVDNEFHEQFTSDTGHHQFFPWWVQDDYTFPPGESELIPEALWGDFPLTEAEQMLMKKHQLTRDQIRWYRWKTKEDGELVHQYYPATPEEAFLSISRMSFPIRPLEDAYNNAKLALTPPPDKLSKWVEMGWREGLPWDGFGLHVWTYPERGHTYSVGVDTGEGQEDSDLTVCQVMNEFTGEQTAMLRGKYRPDEIADMVVKLAEYYNHAKIKVEKNGLGAAVCQQLEFVYHYDNCFRHEADKPVGYNMTRDRKAELFGKTAKALESFSLRLNDRTTIREMLSYRVGRGGTLSAPDGKHDDCVMALMLAYDDRAEGHTTRVTRRKADVYASAR